jgi:chemotaxis protein histidine kinase CheA
LHSVAQQITLTLFLLFLYHEGITSKNKIIKAMKNPKKYLKKSNIEMTHFDMMMQYQKNSTPTVSCGSISSGAPPNRYQPGASQGSFLSRSLRRVANYFTQSTAEQAPAQNVCEDEEDEQENAIIIQQNIAPEAAQNIQVQQALQEPTHNVQQLAETAVQPDPEQALQQSPEILEQPTQDTQQVVQAEEALQRATQVTEAAPPETNEAVNEEKKVVYYRSENFDIYIYIQGFQFCVRLWLMAMKLWR